MVKLLFQTSGSWDKIFVFMALRRRKKWWPPEWFRVFSKKSALHSLVNEVPVALELGEIDGVLKLKHKWGYTVKIVLKSTIRLVCVCVRACSVVSDSLQLHSMPGSSVHEVFQERILCCCKTYLGFLICKMGWIVKKRSSQRVLVRLREYVYSLAEKAFVDDLFILHF